MGRHFRCSYVKQTFVDTIVLVSYLDIHFSHRSEGTRFSKLRATEIEKMHHASFPQRTEFSHATVQDC
jgi:hypothetical protein